MANQENAVKFTGYIADKNDIFSESDPMLSISFSTVDRFFGLKT